MREVTDYNTRKGDYTKAVDVLVVRTATYQHKWAERHINVIRGTGVTAVGIALADPTNASGKGIKIKDADGLAASGTITVTAPVVTLPDGTTYQSTIDGATTATITAAYGVLDIYSDGENFYKG